MSQLDAGDKPATDGGLPVNGRDASGSDASFDDAGDGVDRCADGFPRGVASMQRMVRAITPAPEGVAVCPNGDVFVSVPDDSAILRVPLDGSDSEVWTTLANRQSLGMDCDAQGRLFVADFGSTASTVVRVTTKDDPGMPLPNLSGGSAFGALNGVVAVPGVGV